MIKHQNRALGGPELLQRLLYQFAELPVTELLLRIAIRAWQAIFPASMVGAYRDFAMPLCPTPATCVMG